MFNCSKFSLISYTNFQLLIVNRAYLFIGILHETTFDVLVWQSQIIPDFVAANLYKTVAVVFLATVFTSSPYSIIT